METNQKETNCPQGENCQIKGCAWHSKLPWLHQNKDIGWEEGFREKFGETLSIPKQEYIISWIKSNMVSKVKMREIFNKLVDTTSKELKKLGIKLEDIETFRQYIDEYITRWVLEKTTDIIKLEIEAQLDEFAEKELKEVIKGAVKESLGIVQRGIKKTIIEELSNEDNMKDRIVKSIRGF